MPEFAVSLKIVGLSGVKTRESNPTARARLLGSTTYLMPAASQSINYSAATGVRAIFLQARIRLSSAARIAVRSLIWASIKARFSSAISRASLHLTVLQLE